MRSKRENRKLLAAALMGLMLSIGTVFQNCSPMQAVRLDDASSSVDPRLFDVSDEISKFSESTPDPKKCFLDSLSVLNWTNAQDFTELNFSTLDILYAPTLVTVISIANESSNLEPLPPGLTGWSIQPVRKIVKAQQTVTDIVVRKYSTSESNQLDCYVGSPGHLEIIKDIGQSGDPVSLLGLLNDTSKLLACKISKGDEKITVSSSDRKLIQISAAAPIVFKRGCNVEYEREKLEEQANIIDQINLQERAKAFSAQLVDLPEDFVTTAAAATTPGKPVITSVVAGNQSVEIRFNPPNSIGSSPISSYDIFFNDNDFPSRSATSSPVTITGLLNDTPIKFRIAANNMSGRGDLSEVSASTVTPNAATAPSPPLKVRGEARSGTQDEFYSTDIYFDPPGSMGYSKITRFDVYNLAGEVVATGTGSPITVAYSDLSKKTLQSSGTQYTYYIKAVNAQGSSLASNSTTVVTAPGKVWILPADAANEAERGIVLSSYMWSPAVTSEYLTVKIRFKRKPIFNQNPLIAPIPRPEDPIRPNEYGASISKGDWYCGSFDYFYLDDSDNNNEIVIERSSYYPRAFKMGCSGSFYVVAYQTKSIDQWGNVTSRISSASSEGSVPSLAVPIPPPAVQKIASVQVINDHSVRILFKPIRDGWEDNGLSPLRRWEVVNGLGGAVLATKNYGGPAVLDETIQVDNLENGVRYELYVRAVNDIGPGVISYPEMVVVILDAKPLAPTDLKAITGDGQVTLSFTPATRGSRAETFEVLEMDGNRIVKVAATGFSSSPATVKNLSSTRAYTYTVRGVNRKGSGELSAPVTFTPALQAPKLVAETSYSLAAGVAVSIKLANTGGEIANCSATGLPATLSINSTTCEIYGMLKAGANLSVVVSAKNRIATDTASFTVSIVSCSVRPTKSNISRGDMLTAAVTSTPTVREVWVNCTDPRNLTGIVLKDATGAVVTNTSVPVPITQLGEGVYTCKSWAYLSEPDSMSNTRTNCEDFVVNVDEGVTCGAGSAHFPSEPNVNGQKNLCAVTWAKSLPASISNSRVYAIVAPGTVADAKCNEDGTFSDIQASCPLLPVDYCPGGVVTITSGANAAGQTQDCRGFYPALARNRQTDSTSQTPDNQRIAMDKPGSGVYVKCDADGNISSFFKTCPIPTVAPPPSPAPMSYPFGGIPPGNSNMPDAPVMGLAYAGDKVATVSFVGSSPRNYPVTSYEVYVNSESTPRVTGVASPISITGLTNGVSYFFRVKSRNSVGLSLPSAASNTVTPTAAPREPSAPTIGKVSPGDSQVTVNFAAPASDGGSPITGYEVYANGEATPRASGSSSPINVTGLVNGQSYTFRVRARNANGLSEPSLVSSSVTPMTTPGRPTTVTANAGDAQAFVSFTPPLSTGGSPITYYEVFANDEATAKASGQNSPIAVTGLTNGVSYTFRVKARNARGLGDPSEASNSVTPTASVTRPGPPIIGIAVAGDTTATVTFAPPTSNGGSPITTYEIYANGEATLRASGSASPITVTGLTNGVSYTFKVKARNAVGLSDPSGASNSVTPTASVTRPGPPIIGIAVAGDTTATVTFAPPTSNGGSPITTYEIYANGEATLRASGSASPITVTGLTNGVSYTFRVKARNAVGLSDPSGASNSVTPTHAHTQPIFHCNVVSSTLTAYSVNGEIIADSDHFNRSGRYFVAGYDSAAGVWHSFDGASWYAGGPDPTNLKAIANFSTIDAIGIRGIILSNEDMTPYKGDTIYIGYGLGNTEELAADDMRQNSRFRTCTTVPTQ